MRRRIGDLQRKRLLLFQNYQNDIEVLAGLVANTREEFEKVKNNQFNQIYLGAVFVSEQTGQVVLLRFEQKKSFLQIGQLITSPSVFIP